MNLVPLLLPFLRNQFFVAAYEYTKCCDSQKMHTHIEGPHKDYVCTRTLLSRVTTYPDTTNKHKEYILPSWGFVFDVHPTPAKKH